MYSIFSIGMVAHQQSHLKVELNAFISCCLSSERTASFTMFEIEISSCFPKLRKEFFIQRCFQIADAFGSASAAFRADHALNHLDVMRAPQGKKLIVLQQRLRKLVFFITLFKMS